MTITGAHSASGKVRPAILTDFDDTAAVQNVAELLLQRFGDPTWTNVRQQFRDGQMDLKEYQEITFRNMRADRSAMQHFVRERANLRPFFGDLYQYCRGHDIPLAVVSQGLDFYISALLDRDGFGDVPIYAVDTSFDRGQIFYHYNHVYPGAESKGNSKAFIVEQFQQQGHFVIFAGDGASDQEASERADMVFAHRTLARFCDRQGIEYQPFEDFKAVLLALRELHLNGSATL